MRCLIAGCGYVGTALGLALVAEGHTVYALRRRPEGLPAALHPVAADLTRPRSLGALPGSLDAVVYAVAAAGRDEAAYRAAYVDGLANLLGALDVLESPPRRFLYASSTSVYAQDDGEWVDEESRTEPRRFTGKLVLEGEGLLADRGTLGGAPLERSSVRFGGIYGPGRTRLLESVRRGEARVAPGPPQWTNRVHRDDAAGSLAHLLVQPEPAPVYVGVDCEPAARRAVLDWLAARLGVPGPPEGGEAEPGPRRGGGNKRCRNARLVASGYTFRYPTFREGYGALLEETG